MTGVSLSARNGKPMHTGEPTHQPADRSGDHSADPVAGPDGRAARMAREIRAAFEAYDGGFRQISRRARTRFESRDWSGTRADLVERIELYDRTIEELIASLRVSAERDLEDRELWHRTRNHFSGLIAGRVDAGFYRTFFSSVTRRIFRTVGVDPHVEFLALEVEPVTDQAPASVPRRHYQNTGQLETLFERVLADHAFAVPYRDARACAALVAGELRNRPVTAAQIGALDEVELLATVFYQTNRAYLVGRLLGPGLNEPLVLALANTPDGVAVDAVLLCADELSVLFGYTRSYFLADLAAVDETVGYLRELMPGKSIGELYTVLGRARQGKTERYRRFFRHLRHSHDRFEPAEGERGLVMVVFTLPSHDLVFKVIRDRFVFPKETIREEVMAKYEMVQKHDRAGRLVDAQEFRRFELPRDRFTPAVLDELLTECANSCRLIGNDVLIEHLYVERRLRPLNLYLREVQQAEACAAIIDYGQAIRDLAITNIFPGDLLLKNFGVSRLGRVIFYDYDELCHVTDCNFRDLPRPADYDDEMRPPDWFYVGPRDVFPEQFEPFLGLTPDLRSAFHSTHAELLHPDYWRRMKERHLAGTVIEVIPYWGLKNRAATA